MQLLKIQFCVREIERIQIWILKTPSSSVVVGARRSAHQAVYESVLSFFFSCQVYKRMYSCDSRVSPVLFVSLSFSFFFFYQSSPSFSLAGTSITRGLSIILAVRRPFSTIPIIHAWYPSCFSMSLQYAAACWKIFTAFKRCRVRFDNL